MIILIIVMLFILLAAGLPVAISIGVPSLLYIVLDSGIPAFVAVQRMVAGINTYSLLAIPFFILAGNLMNTGGITTRIFDSCSVTFGRLRGGLAHVNIISSIIFAGMSGAAIADAGGLGAIEIKAMRENKYDERMTIGITAASSIIGPIIPPSMPIVVYGVVASASIGRLFAAGLVPGIIMGLSLMVMVFLLAGKMNCPVGQRSSFVQKFVAFKKAFFPLLTPVIILGGIFSGYFTPTEAAAIACLYALILGILYKEIDLKTFKEAVRSSMVTTVQVLFIVASATLFAWILAREQVPQQLVAFVQTLEVSKWMIILIFNVLLLVVGLFMETVASINILVPVLLPVMIALGMSPIQFGIVMILNLIIGTLTPPFGTVLFVLSGVANVSVEKVAKSTFIFVPPLIVVLILINVFPDLTLWLPNLFYGLE
ncbi:MAG: TRAP transporter large permease [Spirochaetales bacterium]|uniref:TRAP transporter large permease n=1 Tax=Candidatus Thalassospirochaeta sargassi TaxID=3119039 RepID=A0AAJ1I9G5_9SPIO|nr:TRAP transporter large permease [Spirochaetales bacterium]